MLCFRRHEKNLSGYKIGFDGLGDKSRANARHLHAQGAKAVVWNPSEAPVEAAMELEYTRVGIKSCLHPLLVVLEEAKLVAGFWLRPGN